MGRDGERQAHVHAARIPLDRGFDEIANLGKIDDSVKLAADFLAAHAENGAVKVDIFATSKFIVEAGTDLQQRSQAACYPRCTDARLYDSRQDFEKCAFASAVQSDDADIFAASNVE